MGTFYHGDCLFVMKHDIQPNSIDLIYLDPPFFTGKIQKGEWRPEAMEVSYEDSKKFWAEKADVMREKAPEWLRHIALKQPDFASYLYYMMERLRACHDVLKPTGSIYLHCDYRASHYLKMIMDEIFGYDKFRNEIVWFYPFAGRSKSTFPKKHDILFWYSKSSKYVFNDESPLVRIPITDKSVIHNYRYFDEDGRQYRSDPRKSGKTYRYFLDAGKIPEDVWTDIPSLHFELAERVGYPTQKPEKLLERIIGAHTKEGDVVLDPFCGCGTTLVVAHQLGRKWVGIDVSPKACDIMKDRLNKVGASDIRIVGAPKTIEELKALEPFHYLKIGHSVLFSDMTKPPNCGIIQVRKSSV